MFIARLAIVVVMKETISLEMLVREFIEFLIKNLKEVEIEKRLISPTMSQSCEIYSPDGEKP